MSWSKSVTLWCDEDGCPKHSGEISTSRVGKARQMAAERGWEHHNGNDYCPEHSEKDNGT